MSTFARIDPATALVRDTVELSPAQIAELAGNPKLAFLKPLVTDAQPTPTAGQVVVSAGYVIEASQVRQTWTLRAKMQVELDSESQSAELLQLRTQRAALQTDVAAGITAAPGNLAQVTAEIQDLKRRAMRADRILLYLLKQT